MDSNQIAEILTHKGVKPTANRILVAKALINSTRPVALAELTNDLKTVDKSSVYRTLCLFLEKDVVHSIDDGSGSLKYELCLHSEHSISDMHAHFYCTTCGNIFCLDDIAITPSQIALPEGFIAHSSNYVIKGLCKNCSNFNK